MLRDHRQLDARRRRRLVVVFTDGKNNAGMATKEIASQLAMAEDTVKKHVGNILEKLAANDRTHAVTIGFHFVTSRWIWSLSSCGVPPRGCAPSYGES